MDNHGRLAFILKDQSYATPEPSVSNTAEHGRKDLLFHPAVKD